jgi:hypothetical protein
MAQDAPPSAAPTTPVATTCPAGCEVERPREGFGSGGLSVGVGFLSLGKLNDRLTALGFEKVSTTPISISGHGRGSIGKFVLGGRGGAFVSPNVDGPPSTDGSKLELNYTIGWGGAELGYALVNEGLFAVTPVVIVGGYGMTLFTTDDVKRSFGDALTTPSRNSQTSQGGALIGVSVPVDVRIALKDDSDGDHAGIVVGIEPTFLYGIPFGDFASGTKDASDSPKVGLTGGYLAISVGAGTWLGRGRPRPRCARQGRVGETCTSPWLVSLPCGRGSPLRYALVASTAKRTPRRPELSQYSACSGRKCASTMFGSSGPWGNQTLSVSLKLR